MGVWEFVLVYLAAFVLVQLAIYRYLRGRQGDDARVAFAGPSSPDGVPGDDRDRRDARERRDPRVVQEAAERPRGSDDARRRCPSCGATNDPDEPYTFCRNCASRLPG